MYYVVVDTPDRHQYNIFKFQHNKTDDIY